MGVIYAPSLRTARMGLVETAIDSGVGANGTLEIGTAGMGLVLVTFNLSNPAGVVSGDVLTGSGMPISALGANAGTAVEAQIKDKNGSPVVTGLAVGTDVIISPSSISVGQTCNLTALTLTHNSAGI